MIDEMSGIEEGPTRVSSSLIGVPLSYGLVPHLSKKSLVNFQEGPVPKILSISLKSAIKKDAS